VAKFLAKAQRRKGFEDLKIRKFEDSRIRGLMKGLGSGKILISIEKKAPADLADFRRFCADIICIPSVALCAFSVALCVTTVFFFHERREVYKVYKVDSKIRRFGIRK